MIDDDEIEFKFAYGSWIIIIKTFTLNIYAFVRYLPLLGLL